MKMINEVKMKKVLFLFVPLLLTRLAFAQVEPSFYFFMECSSNDCLELSNEVDAIRVEKNPAMELNQAALLNARIVPSQNGGQQLFFTMTDEKSKHFQALTTAHNGKKMGIVFDGKLISAPRINGPIEVGEINLAPPPGIKNPLVEIPWVQALIIKSEDRARASARNDLYLYLGFSLALIAGTGAFLFFRRKA